MKTRLLPAAGRTKVNARQQIETSEQKLQDKSLGENQKPSDSKILSKKQPKWRSPIAFRSPFNIRFD
jgi:hypothetical protein